MILRFAYLSFWRSRKSAEFRILGAALGLAIFAVTLLTCLTQALSDMFVKDAGAMLGADLIIESPHSFSPTLFQAIDKTGLAYSQSLEFFSMLSIDNRLQLANVNAIAMPFPLRGQLIVGTEDPEQKIINQIPQSGEIWLEMSLMNKLEVTQNQSVQVGNMSLKITGVIQQHPLALSSSNLLAPLAYVNFQDLEKMAVLQPGSRATYRILIKSDVLNNINIQRALESYLPKDANIITPQKGRRGLSNTIMKIEQYLSIILLIQVLLAGIAVGMCANEFSLKQKRNVALMRCLGASSRTIFSIHIIELLLLALLMMIIGIGAGYGVAQFALSYAKAAGFYGVALNFQGGLLGGLTGLLLLLGFALPPIVELRKVSPSQIFQGAFVKKLGLHVSSYAFAILTLLGLFFVFVSEPDIALQLAIQTYILGAIAYGLAWIIWLSFKPLSRIGGLTWRFGLTYLIRHKNQSISQWLVFTLVIMLLLLLQIIKQDFLQQWREQLPKETPNYFLLNVQSEQILPLQNWLQQKGIKNVEFYPIVRGRMSHINGELLGQNRGLSRSLNLTWMAQLPKDNQIMAGEHWSSALSGQSVISVEQGFAQRQNLHLHDTVSFQIDEKLVTAKIIQIRALEWTSFKPNFFVIFPENILNDFPHSYITSIYVSNSQKQTIMALTKEFVEISMIDIEEILFSIRNMIDKLSSALESLLVVVFALGILIMYASLLSSLKERIQESAMLQVLGANKTFIAKMLIVEFGLLGLFSGVVGSLMAMLIAKDLAARYFDLILILNMKWFWWGALLSTLVITLFGLIGTRSVFRVSPLWLLRENPC
jgi:putative ABC transport system permease protein